MRYILIPIITFTLLHNKINAQSFYSTVYHPELTAQVSANQGVRMVSLYNIRNLYKKQKEAYDDVTANMTQILAVHEYIYSQLRNVNSIFRQGRKVVYISELLIDIAKNKQKTARVLVENPQYSIWFKGDVIEVGMKTAELISYVQQVIQKADKKMLMDSFDRDVLLENVIRKLEYIRFKLQVIRHNISYAKSRPYIYTIPNIGSYVFHDKIMVQNIINNYNIFNSL